MKQFIQIVFILCQLSHTACDSNIKSEKELNPSLVLWYNKPASIWTEALSVGNVRLGAMVYGGIEKDSIQFNEETLWTGQPYDYSHKGAHKVLDDVTFKGKLNK